MILKNIQINLLKNVCLLNLVSDHISSEDFRVSQPDQIFISLMINKRI